MLLQEKSVLTGVVEARAKATQIKVDASDLTDPDKIKAFQDAQAQLTLALGRLLAVSENYPELKSNANFIFDESMPGFGLRIRAGDKAQHRTFIAQYKIGSKHRRITLGDVRKVTLENARKEAKRIFGKVANGHDPANEKAERRSAASHTLDATVARYLEAKATELKPRSMVEVKRYL